MRTRAGEDRAGLPQQRTPGGRSGRGWVVRRRLRRLVLGIAVVLLVLAALLVLPFVVFVRGSVYAYAEWGLFGWPALGVGMGATAILLAGYGVVISKWLTGKARVRTLTKWVALPVVLCYAAYGLWYVSSVNVKTDAVRSHYTALHPLLRVGLGTIVLADRDIVVTDARRLPDDYWDMGLPSRDRSRHYVQADGYVHAVDLRTEGRSGLRNWSTALYFRLMGFGTLRHVGTADHLHVTLPQRGPR